MTERSSETQQLERAVAEGGAYEVLHKRLGEQGARLSGIVEALNAQRLAEFGSSEMAIAGRLRVRTEHNCTARDIVQVGNLLLFGYNVFIGLKKETAVGDVFSLYRLVDGGEGFDVEPVALDGSFLDDPGFRNDFRELYAYYKHTRLLQLVVRKGRLLACFQIGERLEDVRVFRWSVSADGSQVRYIDNRGERDIAPPPAYDFEWTRCTREHAVHGRHPHLNILDTVFVETIGGDLTVKVENNTEDGLGVYREPVTDKTQSLDDAVVEYAAVGSLILLRVLPYREEQWRHLVFNRLTRSVLRIDAIGSACIQLPEDHGIVFPGGYVLQNGEHRRFERSMDGMAFKRALRSPNGEDILYVFYEPEEGRLALFTYNLIQRRLQTPIFGHGYALMDDGRMVVFSAESAEATRVHPMQLWSTPFASEEFAARQPPRASFMGRIGNAEVVRGLSDLLGIAREIESSDVSAARYERLVGDARRLFDLHHWIDDGNCQGAAGLVKEIAATAEQVLDEYEKVVSIRRQSEQALDQARTRQTELLRSLQPERWEQVADFVEALNGIAALRGRLLTIRDFRYIDVAAIDTMEQALREAQERIAQATGSFLATPAALEPLGQRLEALEQQAQAAAGVAALREPLEGLVALGADLDMLSNLMGTLPVDDAAERTRVVEAISSLYARLNQARARAEQRRRSLGSAEAVAQFGAQFQLFGQSVASALSQAREPESCEEQLARVLVQLEELESQFGEHEGFLNDILEKREEVLEAFEGQRQALLDERQRKAQGVHDAALRILDGLPRRSERLSTQEQLNAFFAGDALILKLRELAGRLRTLKDPVKADDIEARLKAARDSTLRALRDRSELFEGDGTVIRLGRHRFSVNRQELDLTLMPREDGLYLHLAGTDFLQPLDDAELQACRDYWQVDVESETTNLYRAEYLAGCVLEAADRGEDGLSAGELERLAIAGEPLALRLREFAAPRYREGYQKGIHDHDAALILAALLPLQAQAGALRFAPDCRALALLGWSVLREQHPQAATWPERARAARRMRELFGHASGALALRAELQAALEGFLDEHRLCVEGADPERAAAYLAQELAAEHLQFHFSKYAGELAQTLRHKLEAAHAWHELQDTLRRLDGRLDARWTLVLGWLEALLGDAQYAALSSYRGEAAALLLVGESLPHRIAQADLRVEISGLLGSHPRLTEGRLSLALDDFESRFGRHRRDFLPGLKRYHALRQARLEAGRAAMRLSEFKPKPLTAFVRNRLISEIYLPLIGDNLAKQMGTVGEDKRSDLSGLLLLISPPGYGKTTLMEYVAHRLGLNFMKINGPALGHGVHSLDPAQAPDATAARELEKLNLALEMGNNTMLYVDDIQHTHPEFLQKFISLCDATRRIEGVWQGRTRTYDMRGKKFCVVMAGNPYTESGEVFKIPDMLANRADVYNLGDVLGGMQDAFRLSYIENCLTSNPVLAPLATREMADIYKLIDKAAGKPFSANELAHSYSAAEIAEIEAILRRLMQVRDIVFRVNQQYIASAAQDDAYRTEPPFKLQGSYRNMNKLAEKLSPAMSDADLEQLLRDHYQGESQLLTSGAEENLLKLAELLGRQTPEEQARWEQICNDYRRNKSLGGADSDVGLRVAAQLHDLVQGVRALSDSRASQTGGNEHWPVLIDLLQRVASEQALARTFSRDTATDGAMWLGGLRSALEQGFRPLVDEVRGRNDGHAQQQQLLAGIASRLDQLLAELHGKPATPSPSRKPPAK
ncbi:MAG TPA: DNA repair ATPase [Arenimonas sp.]|nr:DNA repair ATPase [Arenimonas sp.]